MIKAVFMDYTGTIVQEEGKEIGEAVAYWWKQVKEYAGKRTFSGRDHLGRYGEGV